MKLSIVIFTVLMLVPGLAFADTRVEKIEALMKAQGVLEMWQQQIDQSKEDCKKMGAQMFAQLKNQLNPNEEFMSRLEVAFNRFLEKATNTPWTAQEITDTWAKYYGAKFTDGELDQLIAFYTSDIGQKEVTSSGEALAEFTNHFKEKNMVFIQKILKDYMDDLKMIVEDCKKDHCTKA